MGPSFLPLPHGSPSSSDQAEDHAAPATLSAVGNAESFRLFGHDGLSHLRPLRTRKQRLRWSHESTALALTSPGCKHERSAMRHGGPVPRRSCLMMAAAYPA